MQWDIWLLQNTRSLSANKNNWQDTLWHYGNGLGNDISAFVIWSNEICIGFFVLLNVNKLNILLKVMARLLD